MPDSFYKDMSLNGKFITNDDPATIDTNFQELKNMRYEDKTIRGIGGMTKVNTTAITSFPRMINGFHFRKEQPAESHIVIQGEDTSDTNPTLFQHSGTVPTTAVDFPGGATPTVLYTQDTAAGTARFADAPGGQVVICDSKENLIWSGDEHKISSFINIDDNDEDSFWVFTKELQNTATDSNNVAVLNPGTEGTPLTTFYVASTRPLKGVKFAISVLNSATNTMAVSYWRTSTAAWVAVSGLSDATHDGTSTLAITDQSITWSEGTHSPKFFKSDFLFYYKFQTVTAACSATTALSHVTVDSQIQPIKNLWGGTYVTAHAVFQYGGSSFADSTINVFENSWRAISSTAISPETYIPLTGLTTTDFIYVGFTEPMTGIFFNLQAANVNAANTTATYWDGDGWTSFTGEVDGTKLATETLSQSGVISWESPTDEVKTIINDTGASIPLYYYRITWSAALSAANLFFMGGILALSTVNGYKFPLFSKNRIFLCSNQVQDKNSVLVSAADSPDVYNGDDSTELFFGDDKELTAGIGLYSRLASNIYDITLFYKSHAMFGLTGFTPQDFQPYNISETIGCVAPLTLANGVIQIQQGITRPIVIWQAHDGIYVFDNTSPVKVSKDLDNFFDKNQATNTNRMHPDHISKSIGFIDPDNNEYHWLFVDGSGSGTLNREFVFDLQRLKWYEAPRAGSKFLQCGFQVTDTNANKYTYGCLDTGFMERLENGTDMDGTAFPQSFRLGDIAPVEGSISTLSQVIKHKIIMIDTGTAATVAVTHYGDGKTAGTSLASAEDPTNSGFRIADVITDTNKSANGHIFHSTQYSMTSSDKHGAFHPLYTSWKVNPIGEDKQ